MGEERGFFPTTRTQVPTTRTQVPQHGGLHHGPCCCALMLLSWHACTEHVRCRIFGTASASTKRCTSQ